MPKNRYIIKVRLKKIEKKILYCTYIRDMISNEEYKKILVFYNKKIPKSSRLLREQATHILSTKLCRCIKKLDPTNEEKSIGICTRTIFTRKGLRRGDFSCKKKPTVLFESGTTSKSGTNTKKREILFTKTKQINRKTQKNRKK